MKENSERQVFNYKNVPITIIRYNGKPYVDCRNIGRLLKRCISGWVKDNRNQIAIYCNGNGIKVNKAIITNRWLLEDIALMYAKSISNDFFEAMKQAINKFNVSSTINDKPMNQLTKSSTNEEIKAYFNAILKLAKASEKYPVNLDEVWMLVYTRRDSAIDALKRDFIENDDLLPSGILRKVESLLRLITILLFRALNTLSSKKYVQSLKCIVKFFIRLPNI